VCKTRLALPASVKSLSKAPKVNGAPRLLFVSAAALRVIDISRQLKKLSGDIAVPQLFSRHHKLTDHVTLCSKTAFNVAVGTSERLAKLLDADALSLSSTSHLLLDVTYRDAKKQTLLDLPDARLALFKTLLAHAKVMQRLRGGRMKLVLV